MLASQLTPEKRIMSLWVGDSGSGKSCAAAFFARLGKVKWMALTKRVYGIMGHPMIGGNQELLKNIDINFYDIQKGFKAIDDDLEVMLTQSNRLGFQTLIVEDYTTASDLLQDDAFKFTSLLKNSEGKNISWHKKMGNVDIPGLDEYAYEDKAFKDITLALNALPCNVIVMVHWSDRYEDNKVVGRKISLRNATIPKVIKWFNEVWFFEKKMSPKIVDKQTISLPDFKVTFENDLARTSFPALKKINNLTWTDKDFIEVVSPHLKIGE